MVKAELRKSTDAMGTTASAAAVELKGVHKM